MEAIQSKKKRIGSAIILLTSVCVLFFYNWIQEAVKTAHVMPDVERCDIEEYLTARNPSEEVLQLLSKQTGLDRQVILKQFNRGTQETLKEIQDIYFEPVGIESLQTTPFTISEWLADEEGRHRGGMPLADIRTGDILITKNSRFFGWRNGHAGLVVDAEKGLVLEALMLGTESCLCDVKRWERYPSYLVLRLKEPFSEKAAQAAEYAGENLVDIPYELWAGIFGENVPDKSEKEPEEGAVLSGTQCAHLVWYAYMQVGIDLDSDGGILVTPEDISNSPYLKIVQKYGY